MGLPRDLEAEVAGPAQGSLGASSQPPLPTQWKPAGGEVWEDEWYPCDGGPPAADPSSPEPQASGLRLPQRQCQTGAHNSMQMRLQLGAILYCMPRHCLVGLVTHNYSLTMCLLHATCMSAQTGRYGKVTPSHTIRGT